MKPGISHVIGDQSQQHSIAHDKAKDGDQPLNDAEDFEECFRGADTTHAGEEGDYAG